MRGIGTCWLCGSPAPSSISMWSRIDIDIEALLISLGTRQFSAAVRRVIAAAFR